MRPNTKPKPIHRVAIGLELYDSREAGRYPYVATIDRVTYSDGTERAEVGPAVYVRDMAPEDQLAFRLVSAAWAHLLSHRQQVRRGSSYTTRLIGRKCPLRLG